MSKRVFVTGSSGFVGSSVVQELLARQYEVVALSRSKDVPGAKVIRADIFDHNALVHGITGCAAIIHLIGIISEIPSRGITFQRMHIDATRSILNAAVVAGATQYTHISALGARPNAVAAYHQTKFAAEELVRASPMDWNILRPSMIHGPGGEFMRMEAAWARRRRPPYLFMPYFGAGLLGLAGAGRIQPLYVKDVARALVDSLQNPLARRQIYELGGPEQMTWPRMHHIASRAIVGRKRPAIPIPAWYAKFLTRLIPRTLLPFNQDQVIMSQEDNTCDLTRFRRDFQWEPAEFAATLHKYAGQL